MIFIKIIFFLLSHQLVDKRLVDFRWILLRKKLRTGDFGLDENTIYSVNCT